jgi:hypothetical protein
MTASQLIKILFVIGLIALWFLLPIRKPSNLTAEPKPEYWKIRSVDTMKYSRDMARQPLGDDVIERQVADIAETGATHVALGTPYDAEFVPFLERWVSAVRRHGLNVWFRGNFSGWEGWFDYSEISRQEHNNKLTAFLTDNKHLFADGDLFTSCTECENGGPGDPRQTGDVEGFRQFFISEHNTAKKIFSDSGKDVKANLFSMNADVARLTMNRPTAEALESVVVIDHYTRTVDELISDIDEFYENTGADVIIGEFGVPVPDLHGDMTQEQQAEWLSDALSRLRTSEHLLGMNYWVSVGGSTQLWNDDSSPRLAVSTLTKFYNPSVVSGFVINDLNLPVANAELSNGVITVKSDDYGIFQFPYTEKDELKLKVTASDHNSAELTLPEVETDAVLNLTLANKNFIERTYGALIKVIRRD